MATPTYGIVCTELHAARQHLYDMIRPLSQDELWWVPPRRDGVCVSYHFGHIAVVEDEMTAAATQKPARGPATFRELFSSRNANDGSVRFPPGADIIDYMQAVRAITLGLVAMRFRAIRDDAQAIESAELFRKVINHEYSHTKYIRRICREMGKPEIAAPPSELVAADDQAIAGPQYRIQAW